MFLRVLLVSSVLFFSGICGVKAQEVDAVSSLEKDSILIGDQVKWSLKLAVEQLKNNRVYADDNLVFPSGVEGMSGVEFDTITIEGKEYVQASVKITSFDSGSYQLPPFPLYLVREDGSMDTLDEKPLSLYVNTIQVDTTDFEIFDIKAQMNYPVTFAEVMKWVALIVVPLAVLLLLGYLIWRFMKNRKEESSKPADPPHIVALRELDILRSGKLVESGKEKEYYTRLTDTMRQYLEGRYGIKTMERTTNEILDDLKPLGIDPQNFKELSDLLILSDFVKFAKYKATKEENDNSIPSAVRFINATFEAFLEEEKADK